MVAENARLAEVREGKAPWRKWGPYLSALGAGAGAIDAAWWKNEQKKLEDVLSRKAA